MRGAVQPASMNTIMKNSDAILAMLLRDNMLNTIHSS